MRLQRYAGTRFIELIGTYVSSPSNTQYNPLILIGRNIPERRYQFKFPIFHLPKEGIIKVCRPSLAPSE